MELIYSMRPNEMETICVNLHQTDAGAYNDITSMVPAAIHMTAQTATELVRAVSAVNADRVIIVNPEPDDAWALRSLAETYATTQFTVYTLRSREEVEPTEWLNAIKYKNFKKLCFMDQARHGLTLEDVMCKCHCAHRAPLRCSKVRVNTVPSAPYVLDSGVGALLDLYLDMAFFYRDVKCHSSDDKGIVFCSNHRNPVGLKSVLKNNIFTHDLFATVV